MTLISLVLHFHQPHNNQPYISAANQTCYSPLAEKRVYENVSFAFSPDLLFWLSNNDKKVLDSIVLADSGQAMAETFTHRILPLCQHTEDIVTEIYWGKEVFKHFFGREPKGMWLPECAVSREVIQELVRQNIKYTIFADNQVTHDASGLFKDKIKYFVINQLSDEIAFNHNGMLARVENTLNEIKKRSGVDDNVVLGCDGETYGFHNPGAENYLKYFPTAVENRNDMELVTLDQILNNQRAKKEKVLDGSSWSCMHGVDRWYKGCDCGGHQSQEFKQPLFESLQMLETKIHEIYRNISCEFIKDPLALKNEYIKVILGSQSIEELFKQHSKKNISKAKAIQIELLLKAQVYMHSAFTSCGWFFEDFGMQTQQRIYDGVQAAVIVKSATSVDLLGQFVTRLRDVRGQDSQGNYMIGSQVAQKLIDQLYFPSIV